jgi:hypothetical protein
VKVLAAARQQWWAVLFSWRVARDWRERKGLNDRPH